MTTYYAYVDTDNGVATPAGGLDALNGKYYSTNVWPANSGRWSSLSNLFNSTPMRAIASPDVLTIFCIGAVADISSSASSMTAAAINIVGNAAGATWDSTKYKIVVTTSSLNGLALAFAATANCSIEHIQIEMNGTSINPTALLLPQGSNRTHSVNGCYIRMGSTGRSSATSGAAGISATGSATGRVYNINNCIVTDVGSASAVATRGIFGVTSNAATYNIYNCTIQGITGSAINSRGIDAQVSDTVIIKNSAVFNTGDDFNNCDTINYCASDDGDGTNAVTGLVWTNQFEDYVAGDFRIKTNSSLIAAGVGPTIDVNVPILDISGIARSGATTDIGSAMYVSTITSISSNNTIYANSSNVVVTGTSLTDGVYAKLVYANQEIAMLSYTANSTQPYFTSPSLANVFSSGIQFTDSANLQILNATSSIIATKIVSFQPPTTKTVHNVTDVSQASNVGSIYYGQSPNEITVGDQIVFDSKSSLTYNVSLDSQGFITIDSLNTDANDSFTYRVYESTAQVWGSEGTITFIGEPVSPAGPTYFSKKIKMKMRVT